MIGWRKKLEGKMPKSYKRYAGIIVAGLVGMAYTQGWIDESMAKTVGSFAAMVFGVGVVSKMNKK